MLVREQPINHLHDPAQPLGSIWRSSKDNEPSNHYNNHTHAVSCRSFDMWVKTLDTPDRIEDALHVYTGLQRNQVSAPPMPLEDLIGWQSQFPHLAALLSGTRGSLSCDIIIVEANLRLMDDFHPPGSRLVISLGLTSRMMNDWTCSNYLYEDGHATIQTEHNIPQPHTTTIIKLPFESTWWEKLFTKLTHQKKEAERTGNDVMNDDSTRRYVRSLSVVQEIRAREPLGLESKRMAILLWRFRQTRPGEIGITGWRRLTTSPDTVNLPPFASSSILLNKAPLNPLYPHQVPLQNHDSLQHPGADHPDSHQPRQQQQQQSHTPTLPTLRAPTPPQEGDSDESMDLSIEDPPGLFQIGALTDSGYASTNFDKHGHFQSTSDARLGFPGVSEHDLTERFETPPTYDSLEMTAGRTVYSDTSSIAPLRKESYISLFSEELFLNLVSWQPDAQAMERISEALPELLRAFALKIGHNAPSQIHRDVMVFIHKNRE